MLKKITTPLALGTLCLSAVTLSSAIAFADSPDANHDARYITIHTAWTHWSANEQKEVIDEAATILQNSLGQVEKAAPGSLPNFSNTFLPTSVLDKLTSDTENALKIGDSTKLRDLLPAGFMIWAGGSSDLGLLVHGKFSMDVGLVFVPSKVTIIDTWHQEPTVTKYESSLSLVGVPHGYLGLGAGAGASASVGISLIWGDLNDAHDFGGVIGGAGADLQFLAGLDGEAAIVHNTAAKKTFGMLTLEGDIGAEAKASIDGESGVIEPLQKALEKIHFSAGAANVVSNAVSGAVSSAVSGADLNQPVSSQGGTQYLSTHFEQK